MATIRFGFINTPYTGVTAYRPMTSSRKEAKRGRKGRYSAHKTADMIAGILEDQYQIVETFWELHEQDIIDLITKNAVEELIMEFGGRRTRDMKFIYKKDAQAIEKLFRSFLDNREMDGLVDGVPTQRSLLGRMSHRVNKKPGRPSFIETGIYRSAFRVFGASNAND